MLLFQSLIRQWKALHEICPIAPLPQCAAQTNHWRSTLNFFDAAQKLSPKDSLPSPLVSSSHIRKEQSLTITKYSKKHTHYQILRIVLHTCSGRAPDVLRTCSEYVICQPTMAPPTCLTRTNSPACAVSAGWPLNPRAETTHGHTCTEMRAVRARGARSTPGGRIARSGAQAVGSFAAPLLLLSPPPLPRAPATDARAHARQHTSTVSRAIKPLQGFSRERVQELCGAPSRSSLTTCSGRAGPTTRRPY